MHSWWFMSRIHWTSSELVSDTVFELCGVISLQSAVSSDVTYTVLTVTGKLTKYALTLVSGACLSAT